MSKSGRHQLTRKENVDTELILYDESSFPHKKQNNEDSYRTAQRATLGFAALGFRGGGYDYLLLRRIGAVRLAH